MQTVERRALDFTDFDQVVRDVEKLQSVGYERLGDWDLGLTCEHLAITIEHRLDGRKLKMPSFILRALAPVAGPIIFRKVLRTRRMPSGVKAPPEFAPPKVVETDSAVKRLGGACERAKRFDAPAWHHPFFGTMNAEQWKQLMLIHCAHHLSHLVPKEA